MSLIVLEPQLATKGFAIKLTLNIEPSNGVIKGPVSVALNLDDGDNSLEQPGIQASGSCLVQQRDNTFLIYSGALHLHNAPNAVKQFLWPKSDEVQSVLIGPSGLQIEVKKDNKIRRLQLVRWSTDGTSAPRWQLLSVDNEPVGETQFLSPAKRLQELLLHIFPKKKDAPVEFSAQFSPREGAVFYDVIGEQVWEVVRPTWAVKVAGATWNPGYCAVSADGNQLFFDDYDFEFENKAPTSLDKPDFKAKLLILNDADATLEAVPSLYASGATSDVNPNQPFVWHRASLTADQAVDYAGVWVRYHLEPRVRVPQLLPAATEERGPRLSRPLALRAGGWELFVDSAQGRMRLTLTQNNESTWEAQIDIEGAYVRARSPELRLYLEALSDPAALPNVWDADKKMHNLAAVLKSTRLEFASDTQPPEPLLQEGLQAGTLVAVWKAETFQLTPSSPKQTADPALAMAFVPGPEAGIDLVPWSGRNLLTKEQLVGAEPTNALPRPPDFNQGLMAVEMKEFVWGQNSKIELKGVNRPDAGGVMALLPWAEWQAGASAEQHTIHPFHRNLVQEHNEWATGAEDLAKDTPDIGLGPEERRKRQLDDLRRAVRDRYAAAADDGLLALGNVNETNVSHWLPGTSVQATITYAPAGDDDLPSLKAKINGADEQALSLKGDSPWLDTRLSWTLQAEATAATRPEFKREDSLNHGAVHVADSSAPLVFQNGSAGTSARVYDNLGVVRDLPAAGSSQQDGTWQVDHLSISGADDRRRPVRSLSTVGAVNLIDSDGIDIQFISLDLKLQQEGDTWAPLADDEPAVALGTYGFFALTKGHETLGQARIWPRLDGTPIFPTRLLSVTLMDDSPQPQTLTFQGVLTNPAALTVERAEEVMPASVVEALTRDMLVTVTLSLTGDAYQVDSVNGAFYWRFALADQIPVEFGATAFLGRLARLVGKVEWQQEKQKLLLTPHAGQSLAAAFGRVWPLHSCPSLEVGSRNPLRFREQTQDALQVYRTLSIDTADTATSIPSADLKRTRDTLLALTASGDQAHLFDAESGRTLRTISGRHRAVKLAPVSDADAKAGVKAQGLIASDGGLVRFWQMIEGQWGELEYCELLRFRLPAEVEAIDAIHGQQPWLPPKVKQLYFLFRCADGTARLWEKETGQELHTFTLPEAMVTAAAFAPLPDTWPNHWPELSIDPPTLLLALGGSDGSVRVYGVFRPDLKTQKVEVVELRQFFDHGSAVGSISMTGVWPESKVPDLIVPDQPFTYREWNIDLQPEFVMPELPPIGPTPRPTLPGEFFFQFDSDKWIARALEWSRNLPTRFPDLIFDEDNTREFLNILGLPPIWQSPRPTLPGELSFQFDLDKWIARALEWSRNLSTRFPEFNFDEENTREFLKILGRKLLEELSADLFLLSCSEAGGLPSFREVISGREVGGFREFIENNQTSLKNCVSGAVETFGGSQFLAFSARHDASNDQHLVILRRDDSGAFERVAMQPSVLVSGPVDLGVFKNGEGKAQVLIAGSFGNENSSALQVKRFTDTTPLQTVEFAEAPPDILDVSIQIGNGSTGYLVAINSKNRAMQLWHEITLNPRWEVVQEFSVSNSTPIRDLAFGELILPAVLLRLEDGRLGIWDPDMGYLEHTEIEVDENAKFTYFYLDGEPHVHVVDNDGKTKRVWSLTLGQPVTTPDKPLTLTAPKSIEIGRSKWELSYENDEIKIKKDNQSQLTITRDDLNIQGEPDVHIFMSGNRPCVLVLAKEQAVVCDLYTASVLRRWRFPANSNAQLSWVNLPIAATAHGDQGMRLWDLSSGILRRELKELPANHLATETVAEQPWVVAGSAGVKAYNLWTGEEKQLADGNCTNIAAAKILVSDEKSTLAVIAGVDNQVLAWADAANDISAQLPESDQKANAVAVLVHDGATYFAAVGTGGIRLWKDGQPITINGLSQGGNITSLALAPTFAGSQVAIAAQSGDKVMLWDCYDPGDAAEGNAAEWKSSSWSWSKEDAALALAWTDDGPRLLAANNKDACIVIPPSVLRVAAGNTDPECYLQVKLDGFDSSYGNPRLLRGVITRGNKLDLMLVPGSLGIDTPLHVQSGIIQDDYYGFRVEEPGEQGGRGVLVLWDAGPYERPVLNGTLLLEQAQENTSAQVKLGDATTNWSGPRLRLRELDFNLGKSDETAFAQREILTWRLQGQLNGFATELLIDEQTWHPGAPNQTVAGFLRLTQDGQDIQGHIRLSLTRKDGADTITLEPTVFLAQPVANVAIATNAKAEPFGITRDDIVIATPGAGLAVDLIPVARVNAADQVQFVTLTGQGTFEIVPADQVPLNLTFSPDALRSLEKTSIAVPQLSHRLAQGGRLRVQPPVGKPLAIALNGDLWHATGSGRWLLAPLFQSEAGVLAWSEGLAIADTYPLGRQRLQTENVLTIQRTADTDKPPVNVANLMTISTLLGVGRGEGLVFDDKQVRREVVRTGASGVIVRRILRADGRVEYAFVNSPFYALDNAVRELEEDKPQERPPVPRPTTTSARSESVQQGLDPRLIWRWPDGMRLTPGARYQPEPQAAATADQGRVQTGETPGRTFRFRLTDLSEDGGNGTGQRIQISSATAFEGRLPLDRFASPVAPAQEATFLPPVVELGYGVDKPGAMAHHTLRVRDEKEAGESKTSAHYSLTDFAHREPQMLVKPAGAAVEMMVCGVGTEAKPLTIDWKETLGVAPIEPNLIEHNELVNKFKNLGANQIVDDSFKLDAPLLQLVQRVGERIIPIREDETRIFLPITPGGQPSLPELFLVSKADLTTPQTVEREENGDGQSEKYSLYLAVLNKDDNAQQVKQLVAPDGCFDKEPVRNNGNYEIYRLTKRFMEMISGLEEPKLQVIWVKHTGEQVTFSDEIDSLSTFAKVFSSQKTLDPVFISPFAPKAAAIARYKPSSKGFLGDWHERTLFFGDAASAARVEVEINTDELVFKASQQVSIVADHHKPDSIFLIKYLDEGQVVYAVEKSGNQSSCGV